MERTKGIFYLIIASTLWSFGGVLIKLVNWNAMAIAGTRSLIAVFVLVLYLKRFKLNFTKDMIVAACFYSLMVITFVAANKLTTAANAIFLQYTAPVYVAIFGTLILKEKMVIFDYLALAFVFFGMFLFFFGRISSGSMLGNFFAVLSGLAFGLFIVFLRKQKDAKPAESVVLGNFFTAVVGLPFLFRQPITTTNVVGIILLGTVQLGISYIFYSIAITKVTAFEASLIPVIEPILNPIWVFLSTGEYPSKFALIGGTIIVGSITLRYAIPGLVRKSED
ncbi:DMT family transporter [Pseudothermotoga thermarum]|uniref:EamA domain-containing protein n=1 Tax=Pseudothermotoga thermarum DSM 5069 TaxID=688269 RepID=F7YWG2_9THEM|nr:DMT family transporter [Pseudothermotoga thermarum]AEH51941.1 protein of unknown function DUF6 transmembrane [Pseudothermotoga thermarum DSM 5069]